MKLSHSYVILGLLLLSVGNFSCGNSRLPRKAVINYNSFDGKTILKDIFKIKFDNDTVEIIYKPDSSTEFSNVVFDSIITPTATSYFISHQDTVLNISQTRYGPYIFRKEGNDGNVYYFHKYSKQWIKFKQYSLIRNDTSHFFNIFSSFPTEPSVEGNAILLKQDTVIKIENFHFKCYVFDMPCWNRENMNLRLRYYIEKKHLVPIMIETTNYSKSFPTKYLIYVHNVIRQPKIYY